LIIPTLIQQQSFLTQLLGLKPDSGYDTILLQSSTLPSGLGILDNIDIIGECNYGLSLKTKLDYILSLEANENESSILYEDKPNLMTDTAILLYHIIDLLSQGFIIHHLMTRIDVIINYLLSLSPKNNENSILYDE
jgi:hypothetical protein